MLDARIDRPYVVTVPIGTKGRKIPIPFLSLPPFLRPLIKGALGENASLSRIAFKGEKRSFEAALDEIRAVIHHWENDGVLGHDQAERLIEQFHVSEWFQIWYRFIPDLLWYLLTLIGATSTQQGFKEFDESGSMTGGGGGHGGGHH
jgi:hypothetical protein